MKETLVGTVKEKLKPLEGKIVTKPNRSYIAIWLKKKKKEDLILCLFQGKRKNKLCLPWSTIDLMSNTNLSVIIEKFLKFKSRESISKNISKFEKQLKEEGLI